MVRSRLLRLRRSGGCKRAPGGSRSWPQAMAQYFVIHPHNPQPRLIQQAADIVRTGGLVVYPTDSCYAVGCHIGDKQAQERIRAVRQVDSKHHFTLVCRDLSEISHYARVDNRVYRMLKATTPGSYTFILQGHSGSSSTVAEPQAQHDRPASAGPSGRAGPAHRAERAFAQLDLDTSGRRHCRSMTPTKFASAWSIRWTWFWTVAPAGSR